jgi:hypothetical protein
MIVSRHLAGSYTMREPLAAFDHERLLIRGLMAFRC